MHIVDVCAFYSPRGGGVKTYVDQKLAMAGKAGHKITVLAPGEGHRIERRAENARVVTIPGPRFPLDRKYWYFADDQHLLRSLDELQPDIVEVSSPWRSPALVARWRPDVLKALIMHADPLSAYAYRWFGPMLERTTIDRQFDAFWSHLRRLGGQFDTIVCASEDLRSRLRAGGVANTITLPMGVRHGVFSPARRNPAVRSRLLAECGLDDEACLLIAAGRLAPEKRIPLLVGAVTKAGRMRPVGLVIFGEGREERAVRKAISGNPHIRLFRPVSDRVQFATILASCDALVHGCEAETFGMVAAEANASGIPVIVPDAGGAADFAREGGGIQYRAADMADLVRSIGEITPGFLRRAPVLRAVDMEDHFSALFEHYTQLMALRRARAA